MGRFTTHMVIFIDGSCVMSRWRHLPTAAAAYWVSSAGPQGLESVFFFGG